MAERCPASVSIAARNVAGYAAARSVLLLPCHASTHASDTLLLLRTTLLWNDAQQALIGGWRPAGYSADHVRIALGQLPPQ